MLLIVVVIGLPIGTLIAWYRHAHDAEVQLSENRSGTDRLQQQIFQNGDFEFKYFWMRHAGWAVLVLDAILTQFCAVRRFSTAAPMSTIELLHGRFVQASIGRDVGIAIINALYMGLFLWLRPFRKRHR